MKVKQKQYRIVHLDAAGAFIDDTWFVEGDAEALRRRAIDAAGAMAKPGSLSLEPGDQVLVEEHAVTEIFAATKPAVQ